MPAGPTSSRAPTVPTVTAVPDVPAGCRLLTMGPTEWLLISDTLAASTLREHALNLRHQGIAAVGLSPGLAALRLEGPAARDMLTQGCGLDLHPASFPMGTCTRTRLAQLPVIIDYVQTKPRFDLYVGRSYRSYLCSWLHDAALGGN
jgi:sarcosine oxidase subunit gamma